MLYNKLAKLNERYLIMKQNKNKRLEVRLDELTETKLTEISEITGLSLSAIARMAILNYIGDFHANKK